MLVNTLFITGAYLLGSLPHLVLLSRLSGLEPRGDLHLRLWAGGKRLVSIIGVIGDIAKGVLVIMAGRWLELDTPS
jgi:glycerol-3-phosphate acyltransferase PlsY